MCVRRNRNCGPGMSAAAVLSKDSQLRLVAVRRVRPVMHYQIPDLVSRDSVVNVLRGDQAGDDGDGRHLRLQR